MPSGNAPGTLPVRQPGVDGAMGSSAERNELCARDERNTSGLLELVVGVGAADWVPDIGWVLQPVCDVGWVI